MKQPTRITQPDASAKRRTSIPALRSLLTKTTVGLLAFAVVSYLLIGQLFPAFMTGGGTLMDDGTMASINANLALAAQFSAPWIAAASIAIATIAGLTNLGLRRFASEA